jgi:hypothetical protein
MLCGSAGAPLPAQDKVTIKNDTPGFMEVWVWKKVNSRWDLPAIAVRRGENEYLDVAAPGPYYLVARDDRRRAFHMGWFDFHEARRTSPTLVIALSSVYESREEVVWEWDPASRSWRTIRRPINVGRLVFVWRLLDGDSGPMPEDRFGYIDLGPGSMGEPQECRRQRSRFRFRR